MRIIVSCHGEWSLELMIPEAGSGGERIVSSVR